MEGAVDISTKVLPYLRSCKKETAEPIKGEIKGEIPSWLHGSLLRNGSGLLQVGPDQYKHIFDGLSLIHKFSLREGQVFYQNRFLRSDAYKVNMEADRIIMTEFATKRSPDLCKTIFHKYSSVFSPDDFTDNALVNVIQYTDEFYAHTETNYIWKVDPETLESVRKVDLRKYLSLNTATAHAHEDTDGTVYNVGLKMHPSTSYVVMKFPPKEKKDDDLFKHGSIVSYIPASANYPNQSYFHSFGMSENYFIFVEQPLEVEYARLAFGDSSPITAADTMKWHKQEQNIFHVIRRDTGEELPTRYVSKNSFFVFHHINAYEEDGHLVVDMCSGDDGGIVPGLYISAMKALLHPGNEDAKRMGVHTRRYVLPLDVRKKSDSGNLVSLKNCDAKATLRQDGVVVLEHEELAQDGVWFSELPRINYSYNTKKYRYSYAVSRKPEPQYNGLIKVDNEKKTALSWDEHNAMPSEPVFVAFPDSKNEDDGVLLSTLLYKDNENKVSLLVLDARDMTEIGRADFLTESSVPANFHGIYVANS